MNPRLPDFFIVGAPKCGTTALHRYLRQHPEIYMPEEKEFHFFGSDLEFRRQRPDRKRYLSFFSEAGNAERVGEASVWYLYSKKAATEIREFNPDASIIIMLRDPVEMLYSQHSQFLYNGNEDIADFGKALDAEPDRKAGRRIPQGLIHLGGLLYRETAMFSVQVERYFQSFGRDRVHVIIFDEFIRETLRNYRKACAFLGVADNFSPDLSQVNPNKKVRSAFLRRFINDPPSWSRKIAKALPKAQVKKSAKKILKRCNTRYTPRPPMDPELRRRLTIEFAPEVDRLSQVLGKDLTYWCRNE